MFRFLLAAVGVLFSQKVDKGGYKSRTPNWKKETVEWQESASIANALFGGKAEAKTEPTSGENFEDNWNVGWHELGVHRELLQSHQ